MGLFRPGTKVRFWTPGFKNQPSVEPPASLRLVSALSICSVVGVLIYAVVVALRVDVSSVSAELAAYVAVLHFLLPTGIAYAIATNSPMSRPLILVYLLLLGGATAAGLGYLGSFPVPASIRIPISGAAFVLVTLWLYRSPGMRVFYAVLADKPVPPALATRSEDIIESNKIDPRLRATIDWVSDHLETVVLLGFIVVVIYAFVST